MSTQTPEPEPGQEPEGQEPESDFEQGPVPAEEAPRADQQDVPGANDEQEGQSEQQ